jgi:DnaK suppressor protein
MTSQIDSISAVLEDKRAELLRSIRSRSSQLSVSEGEHELLDRMQAMCSRDEAVTYLDVLTRTLAAVDAAIGAVKDGSYGVCVDCGEPISRMRLQIIPWASHCIRCQEVRENGEHIGSPGLRWDEAA